MNDSTAPQSPLEQAGQIQRLERGKLCVLRDGPNGPYYNHQTWENGKNVSRYVPAAQVPAVQEAIAGYGRFQELIAQHVEQKVQSTRAEIAVGAKKKRSRPSSSSRKTRKSSG
jgi:hypothetical protein